MIDQWTQTENWIPIQDGKKSASTENNPSELSQQLIAATQAAKHLYYNLCKKTYLSLYSVCIPMQVCRHACLRRLEVRTKCLSLPYFETEFLTEHGTYHWPQRLVIELWGSPYNAAPALGFQCQKPCLYMEDPNSGHHASPTDILPTAISPDQFKPVGSKSSRNQMQLRNSLIVFDTLIFETTTLNKLSESTGL